MITPASNAPQSTISPKAAGGSQASGLTSDFETFLRMLTAQARNQDPLEPLDSSEYASQLAQFSMVEQQVRTNDMLSGVAQTLGNAHLGQLVNWVGMDVQVAAPFQFDDSPIAMFAAADPDADRSELVVRDAQGAVVNRTPIPIDQTEFVWAGVDQAGNPLPPGTYSATLDSFKGRDVLASTPAAVFSRVVQAQVSGDEIVLTLESGAEVSTDAVTQIRTGA